LSLASIDCIILSVFGDALGASVGLGLPKIAIIYIDTIKVLLEHTSPAAVLF
jgi:hypothetical protein